MSLAELCCYAINDVPQNTHLDAFEKFAPAKEPTASNREIRSSRRLFAGSSDFSTAQAHLETAWSRRHLRILHLIIAASPPDSVSFARSSRFFRTNSRIICLSSANGNMWHKCRFPEIGVPLVIIHFHQIFNSKPASYWVSPCTVLLLLFLSLDRISVPFLMNSPSLRVSVFASSAYTQLARLVQLSYTR